MSELEGFSSLLENAKKCHQISLTFSSLKIANRSTLRMRCRVSLCKISTTTPLHFVKAFFHLFFKSIQGNCFIYIVKFSGLNFPPNGPVMQKKTQGWEPNTERLFARDGMLIGNNFMALKLEGGGHYLCEFKSTYK